MTQLPDKKLLDLFPVAERAEISRIWGLTSKIRKVNIQELNQEELNTEWQRLLMRFEAEKQADADQSPAGKPASDWDDSDRQSAENQFEDEFLLADNTLAAAESVDSQKQNGHISVDGQISKEPRADNIRPFSGSHHIPSVTPSSHENRHSKIGRSFRMKRLYPVITAVAAVLIAAFAGWFYFVPVTIEAPRGAFVTFEWDDGSHVELNSGSQLTFYRSLWDSHRLVTLNGEAYFDITPSDKPFIVQTHNARVQVLGTRFNVRSWGFYSDAETILTLVEGEVTLASEKYPENSVLLQPGQLSRVDRLAEAPYDPEEVDTTRALAWRDQGFYFSSARLSDVAPELERRFNRNIIVQNERLADRTLTLYLPSEQKLESIITSICHLTGCQYDWSEDQVVLY